MRAQNIILFSSGISENNGILFSVKEALELQGYQCSYWRDLFSGAMDPKNIALLPVLIKKIPTFDFAVLICEGHDKTQLVRHGETTIVKTMRDNVLFEIGLCTMALGMNRVILLAESETRLPEDLMGINNEAALKIVKYDPADMKTYPRAAAETAGYLNSVSGEMYSLMAVRDLVRDMDLFIRKNQMILTPTVIGASVSTANGYVSNFVLRLLEKCNEGFLLEGEKDLRYFPDEKIFLHIVLPLTYSEETPASTRARMKQYKKGRVPGARFREVEFYYHILGDELHIVDYPTTMVTSYQTARLILNIQADDRADPLAEKRFNDKELDLFENALSALTTESFIEATVRHFYNDDTKEEEDRLIRRLTAMMDRVSIEREEY